MAKHALPVIDISPFAESSPTCFGNKEPDVKNVIARELVEALHTTGFVYLRNHGLPRAELAEAFAISKQFFDLPMEDKMKAPHPPGWEVHRGYSQPGLEKVSNAMSHNVDNSKEVEALRGVQDFKESYEVGSEDFKDMPNVWPPDDILPGWKSITTSFYWKCFRITSNVLTAIAIGLGLEENALAKLHSGQNGQLRLLHYPPVPAGEIESMQRARMPAHSDWSTITILLQDDCGGLQVERLDQPGSFIDVPPVENTLVLNVGDLLMRWSNDFLKSTQHRVALPQLPDRFSGQERLTQARYSIPFFLSPDPDTVIECLDLGENFRPKYEPITQRDYAAMRARMQY